MAISVSSSPFSRSTELISSLDTTAPCGRLGRTTNTSNRHEHESVPSVWLSVLKKHVELLTLAHGGMQHLGEHQQYFAVLD